MKKKDIIKGMFVLLAITSLSGYLLAQVFRVTAPRIEEQRRIEEERLNREIFPQGASFLSDTENGTAFISVLDSEGGKLGRIFQLNTTGYGGPITVKAGVDNDMKIKAIRILEHRETPGLGARITEAGFLQQFQGGDERTLHLQKDMPEGRIDSITGATVSSRAVTEAVRRLIQE